MLAYKIQKSSCSKIKVARCEFPISFLLANKNKNENAKSPTDPGPNQQQQQQNQQQSADGDGSKPAAAASGGGKKGIGGKISGIFGKKDKDKDKGPKYKTERQGGCIPALCSCYCFLLRIYWCDVICDGCCKTL